MEGGSSQRHHFILALSCLLLFGNYYAYDNPAALNRQLMAHLQLDYATWQYYLNLLYVVYSIPNMFLPYFGGRLVDSLGSRVLLLYSLLSVSGQILYAAGVHARATGTMMLGRFLFGVGGESVVVVQGCLMASVFEGRRLSFALSLNLCVSRLGSVANAILSPILDSWWGVEAAVMGGTLACVISFISSLLLLAILPKQEINTCTIESAIHSSTSLEEDSGVSAPRMSEIAPVLSVPVSPTEATPLLMIPMEPLPAYATCNAFAAFPFSFWILCLMYVVFYGSAWSFGNTASDFLQSKWYFDDPITAGLVMSIPDSTSSILCVICGYFLDTSRHGTLLLILCFATISLIHILLGFTFFNPVLPLFFLGVAYSINPAVIWPSVAVVIQRAEKKLVRNHRIASAAAAGRRGTHRRRRAGSLQPPPSILGAAYGVCTSTLNMALTVIPLCAAWLRVNSGGGWAALETFYAGLGFVGFLGALALFCEDGLREEEWEEEEGVLMGREGFVSVEEFEEGWSSRRRSSVSSR
ncbi:major facilitator superfamily domain-containing protein [Chytriomyces sp. MP71]|nr:major facilitator superfamily domain-containing protein [Chytriomyces sp. MP71]